MIQIQTPTLLLNVTRAKANIERMAHKAQQSDVRFRPHFKTHQSAQIGEWFRAYGVEAITVSSVDMAIYFADHGWQDITIAFPVNILELDKIETLARQIRLNLLVESEDVVHLLRQKLTTSVQIWLKVDTGYGRTGISWSDFNRLSRIANQISNSSHLSLAGLLTHSGHTYQARSQVEVDLIYQDTVSKLKAAQKRLHQNGFGPLLLSIGDTPSCSLVADLSAVDEIRPGNFIFYDLMQLQIGACREEDIAVAVACPVVAKHPDRHTTVIYGGAIHLSKEFLQVENYPPIFGYIARLRHNEWGPCLSLKQAYLSQLSQEHGLVKMDTMDNLKIGDILAVLPVHSCLTVNLLKKYITLEGDIIPCYQP